MTRPADNPGLQLIPYWREEELCSEAEFTKVPAVVSVAIVCAGYAGLSAALILAGGVRARSVALFDAMRAGEGASSRND